MFTVLVGYPVTSLALQIDFMNMLSGMELIHMWGLIVLCITHTTECLLRLAGTIMIST